MYPLIAGLPVMLAIFAGGTAMAQYGSRTVDVPKAQLFTPAPDTPVAPVIVPQMQAPPQVQPQAQAPAPGPAPGPVPARPPIARPAPPPAGPAAPYFIPGARTLPAPAPATDPAAVAEAFYRTYLQIRTPGVPNIVQRTRLRGFITPALEAALAGAEQAEKDYRVKTKGAVPPLVEGDLFASLFEGADSFKVQECTDRAAGMQCHLLLSNTDTVTKQKTEWRDTLLLVRIGGLWRVDDLLYGGKFAFGQTGQLTALLRIVVKESKEDP